jgi:hypothetical protein
MPYIVLTSEQAGVILCSTEPVEARDENGRTVAHVLPLSAKDIEAIERSQRARAANGPRVPSDEVQAHLRRLGEIRVREELTEEKALDLLRRLRAGERV